MKKIIFICTGNICRSPTAHAIARHKAKSLNLQNQFLFDSAGTTSQHEGESPDSRSILVGHNRKVSFTEIYSRPITQKDFIEFDLIMAMDKSHLSFLLRNSPEEYHSKIKLFLEFCEVKNPWNNEVIDPYYLKEKDFESVFDMIDLALDKLFKKLS